MLPGSVLFSLMSVRFFSFSKKKKGQYYFIYFPCRNQNQDLAHARDVCITERYFRLLIFSH